MGKKLSRKEIQKRIASIHGDTVQIDFSTFKNTSSTCRFLDKDYGEFWNIPYNVYKCGQGHRNRFIEEKLKKPVEHIQSKIDKIHNGKLKIDALTYTGSNKRCKVLDKDHGEFWTYPYNLVHQKQRHPDAKKLSREECMKKNTPRRNRVRQIVLEEGLLPYVCQECNQEPFWKNKPLTLHLDHISGDASDNRLENLRFLCPNCHTQTESYAKPLSTRRKNA